MDEEPDYLLVTDYINALFPSLLWLKKKNILLENTKHHFSSTAGIQVQLIFRLSFSLEETNTK